VRWQRLAAAARRQQPRRRLRRRRLPRPCRHPSSRPRSSAPASATSWWTAAACSPVVRRRLLACSGTPQDCRRIAGRRSPRSQAAPQQRLPPAPRPLRLNRRRDFVPSARCGARSAKGWWVS